jgi:LuxR family maltose regulon positive regulatory protein
LTAKQHLSNAFNNKYATRSIEDVIGNVIYLDLLFWHLGLLSQSQAIHQEYMHWAEQSIWKGSIITCLHSVSQAEILREMNQLDQAKELLDEALTLLSEKMLNLSLQDHIINLLYCRLLLSRRDYDTFNKAVSELESLYQHGSFNWHFGFQSVAAMKVQAALGQNNVALAKQLLTAIDVNNTGDLLVQASVQILDAPSDATWQTILDIAARAEHTGNKAWEIQSLQLQAIYLQNCGQSCDANKQFAKALKLAKQHGYVRLLIEEPVHFTSLVSLLQAALDNNTVSSYAKKLLNLLNTGTSKKPVAKAGKKKSLLSKRESQILCYLPEGTSNRDIASQLCITEGTVKWYLNKIYEKLEVKNRTHAVIAAQKKGLLD